MASLALRDQKSEGRTKKDWIKFIMNNEGENGNVSKAIVFV